MQRANLKKEKKLYKAQNDEYHQFNEIEKVSTIYTLKAKNRVKTKGNPNQKFKFYPSGL